jgi:endonuclease/exonuclease/phosphatase family metal-dependent hydrolase
VVTTPSWLNAMIVSIGAVVLLRLCGWRLRSELQHEIDERTRRAARAPRVATRSDIRVLTHNVWAHYFVAAPERSKRMKLLIDYVAADPIDVVCVQELFVLSVGPFVFAPHWEMVASELEKRGFVHQTNPLQSSRALFQNSGLCSFSRLPLDGEAQFTAFATTAEVLNNKGFELLHVDGRLALINTHFDSRKHTQAAQRDQIAAAVRGEQTGPLLAVGDWNISSGDPATFGALSGALGLTCAFVDAFGNKATFRPSKPSNVRLFLQQITLGVLGRPVWPASAGSRRSKHDNDCIDHAFTRGLKASKIELIDIASIDGVPLSDHFGIALNVAHD